MQYLLFALVLAIIATSVAAWTRMIGAGDGVAEAELLDISDPDVMLVTRVPSVDDTTARHAVSTITARHIPLLSLGQGPRTGQAWLHYADGTELLAEERALGALGFLAVDLAMYGPTRAFASSAATHRRPFSARERTKSLSCREPPASGGGEREA